MDLVWKLLVLSKVVQCKCLTDHKTQRCRLFIPILQCHAVDVLWQSSSHFRFIPSLHVAISSNVTFSFFGSFVETVGSICNDSINWMALNWPLLENTSWRWELCEKWPCVFQWSQSFLYQELGEKKTLPFQSSIFVGFETFVGIGTRAENIYLCPERY